MLEGLLVNQSEVLNNLRILAGSAAQLEIRLNLSALSKLGWTLEQGGPKIAQTLETNGFKVGKVLKLEAVALRAFPTSWAKRLGYGRDPQALYLQALSQSLSCRTLSRA